MSAAAAVDPQPVSPSKEHKDKHGWGMGWVKDHLPHKASSSPRGSRSGSQPSTPTAVSPTPPTPTSTTTMSPTTITSPATTLSPTPPTTSTTTMVMHADSPPIVLGLGPERPVSGAAVFPVVTLPPTPSMGTSPSLLMSSQRSVPTPVPMPSVSSVAMPTALSSVSGFPSSMSAMSSMSNLPATPTFGTAPTTPASALNQQVRYVRLCIHEARNLTAKDANGYSDPYVTISLGSQRSKSPIIYKSLFPVWEHEVLLSVRDVITEEIEVNVWDYDRGVSNDFLGRVTMPLSALLVEQSKGENVKRWYTLGKRSETSTVSGELCISHTFLYGGGEDMEVPNLENTAIAEAAELGDRPSDLNGWTLQVHVIEARNLPAMDSDGFSDPYVDIRVGNQSFKTEIVTKNLNPKWDQTFNIEIEGNPEFVKFKVWDFDRKSRDDFIGQAKVPMSKVRVVDPSADTSTQDGEDNNNNNKDEEGGESGEEGKEEKKEQTPHTLRSPSDLSGDLMGNNDAENLDIDARWLILEVATMAKKNVLKKALTSVRHLNSKSGHDKEIRPLGELLVSLKLLPPPKVSPVEEEDDASEQTGEAGAAGEAEDNEPPPAPISVPEPLEVALADEELPVPSKSLHRLIFGSVSPVMEAYNERQQRREVVTKPWVRDEKGQMVRKNQFIMPVNAPMAPKEAQVFETYTMLVHEKGGTVVDLRVDTPHMPYGSSFYIHMQYVIQYKTPKTSRLRITMEVFFVKSPMVKSMIKKGSQDGVVTANKNFMDIVRQMAAKEAKSAGAAHASGNDASAPSDTITDTKSTSSFQPQNNNNNYATTPVQSRGITLDTYLLAAILVLLLFLAIQSVRAVGLMREFQQR